MGKLLLGPQQSGKTTEAIEACADGWLYMVCLNRVEAQRVFEQARTMGVDIPYPITFDDFLRGAFSRVGIRGFVIDNADALLQYIARGVPIALATITQETP